MLGLAEEIWSKVHVFTYFSALIREKKDSGPEQSSVLLSYLQMKLILMEIHVYCIGIHDCRNLNLLDQTHKKKQ